MLRLLLVASLVAVAPLSAQSPFVYKVDLVRAAPGALLDLIELYRDRMTLYDAAGDRRPAIIRHSQGDQWDLMLVYPVGDLANWFSADRKARREAASATQAARGGLTMAAFDARRQALTAWREETFFTGAGIAETGPRFRDAGYFHVEMFVALPGKRDELLRERQMENDYLRMIGRPENLVLTKQLGGAWDAMTIGFYRDLKHYAESADIPADRQEIAARAAGFQGAAYIGSYLRELIASHHDTLGVPVR